MLDGFVRIAVLKRQFSKPGKVILGYLTRHILVVCLKKKRVTVYRRSQWSYPLGIFFVWDLMLEMVGDTLPKSVIQDPGPFDSYF